MVSINTAHVLAKTQRRQSNGYNYDTDDVCQEILSGLLIMYRVITKNGNVLKPLVLRDHQADFENADTVAFTLHANFS